MIGYPLLFVAIYLGACFLLAITYLRPFRSAPMTPEGLEDVKIPTEAGPDPAWASPALAKGEPKGEEPKGRVVFVMAHGYGGTRAAWRGVVERLESAGYEAVIPAMSGQDASPDKTVGFGLKEARVLVDTVHWVRARYPKSHQPKVVLLGVSMGGAASWIASGMIPDEVDGVITEGAYARFSTTMDDWFDHIVPLGRWVLHPVAFFARHMGGLDPNAIVPVDAAHQWHKPALVIQGGNDNLIRSENAVQLSQAAGCPLWTVPGATHADCFGQDPEGYISHLVEFAKRLDSVAGSSRN